jgi:peroxiredoxin Q/BCP
LGTVATSETEERPVALLEPGAKAPDFTARTHSGQDLSLGSLLGRKVVLWFYPKADTPG